MIPLALAVLVTCTAHADESEEELVRLENAAGQAYAEGDYGNAIDLLLKAHTLSPHPNYVLNIAVSYGKLGDCTNAKLFARNALESEPPLDEDARTTALDVIARCDRVVEKPDDTEQPEVVEKPDETEQPEVVEKPDETEQPEVVEKPDEVGQTEKPDETGQPEAQALPGPEKSVVMPPAEEPGLTTLQWVGVGVLSAGVVIGSVDLLAYDLPLVKDVDDFKARNGRGELTSRQYQTEEASLASRQNQILVGYVISGVMVTSGLALVLFGGADDAPEAVSLTPVITDHYAGANLGLRF